MPILTNHPELLSNISQYEGIAAFTDGRKDAVAGYLIRYSTESVDTEAGRAAYANRLARLYNVNHCAPYLTIHRGHLAQKISISGVPQNETFETLLADSTGFGDSAVEFARQLLEDRMRDGRVGVLVDGPASVSASKAEAVANRERSYQVKYTAAAIRDWDYFYTGVRKGALRRVVLDEPPFINAKGEKLARLRRYSIGETGPFICEILQAQDGKGLAPNAHGDAQYDIVEVIPGSLDYIPFFIWGKGSQESFLKEVWELNAALMNLTSVKSNINYNQGFQRNAAVGVEQSEVSKAGEHLIWVFANPEANIITVPAGDPTAIENEESRLKNEINRRGKFEFNQLADDTRQVQSAESKEKDMIARKGVYDIILDEQKELLEKIWQAHLDYESETGVVEVTIERDYGLEDDTVALAELSAADLAAQRLGAREVQKAILRTRISKLRLVPQEGESEEEMRKRLFDDIESAEPEAFGSAVSRFGLTQ